MPQYYMPYSFYPTSSGGYNPNSMQSYMAMPQQINQAMVDSELIMKWVDGEVGAKAFNMPQGWPANRPIPLWDSTDTVIWLKSWGPMGIPNPMQKITYKMPEQQSYYVPANQALSGAALSSEDASVNKTQQYVTKEDINAFREEIREEIKNLSQSMNRSNHYNNSSAQNNQNGSRGDNK